MITWKEEMVFKIAEVCKEGVESFVALIEILGVPEMKRAEWCSEYHLELKNVMSEMHKGLEQKQKNMQKDIIDLKNRIGEITYELGISATFPQEATLYQEENKLKIYLTDLEAQLARKQEEVKVLLQRQEKICGTLGKPGKMLSDKPLPNTEELENFLLYIESLEDECFLREEKFTNTQCELQSLAAEIEYEPTNEFEKLILQQSSAVFVVSDKNMILLHAFEQSLRQHANNIKTEVEIFINQIKQLWSTLETDEKYCYAFLKSHCGYTKATINTLKSEIKRLEDLKKANIEMLVKRLRGLLAVQWDRCHYSEEQRRAFDSFDDDIYTESMLTLFQNELRKVTKHYEDNSALFESLQKYEDTWKRVDELETPVQGQNRFQNRGGKLLLEEKERKLARKRLEKLEVSIMKMSDDYFKDNQEEFTYEGLPVEEFLKSFQEAKDEQRVVKVSSKSTLNASKSSNLMEGCRSLPKVVKPLQSNNSHHSPKRRNPKQGSRNDDGSSIKTQKSSVSGMAKSVPIKGSNPIRMRKEKLKKAAPISNFKQKKQIIITALLQDNAHHLAEMTNSHLQGIIDTSMPTLLNNTTLCYPNTLGTSKLDLESPLALPLTETPSTSDMEQDPASADSTPGTPRSQLKNITMRRMFRMD